MTVFQMGAALVFSAFHALGSAWADRPPAASFEGYSPDRSLKLRVELRPFQHEQPIEYTYLAGVSSLVRLRGQPGIYACKYQYQPHLDVGRAIFILEEPLGRVSHKPLASPIAMRAVVWFSGPIDSEETCEKLPEIPESATKTRTPLFIGEPVWPILHSDGCETRITVDEATSERESVLKKYNGRNSEAFDRRYWSPAKMEHIQSITLSLKRSCSGVVTREFQLVLPRN